MVFDIGDKVYIIERRYFKDDILRHFAGEITGTTENAIRMKGYIFSTDLIKGFVRKEDLIERVFYPSDRLIINIIPKSVILDELECTKIPERGFVVTDGKGYIIDINDFMVT